MKSTKTELPEVIDRIANLINLYASDDQTLRELERVVTGWLAMKHKLREKEHQRQQEQNVNV